MINFAIAGSLGYFKKTASKLSENGYIPKLLIEKSRIIEHKNEISQEGLELLICTAHPYILKKEEISLFRKGCINLHPGIPNYCGRHPINWMMIDGIKEVPVAVHYMDEGIDSGDIILEDSVLLKRDEDYNSVIDKISEVGADLILAAVKQIEANTVYRKKQILPRTYQKRRTPEDSKIDWNKKSYDLHNFINALVDPMPNSFAYAESGKRIEFKRAYAGKNIGEVLGETMDGKYVISTSDGVIFVKTAEKLKTGEKFRIK